jgi:hypothetical protein
VHQNSAQAQDCKTCTQNAAIFLHPGIDHSAFQMRSLFDVYRSCTHAQSELATSEVGGCEPCAQNVGISRSRLRARSPEIEGPLSSDMQDRHDVHATEFRQGSRPLVIFCRQCGGLESDNIHQPIWCEYTQSEFRKWWSGRELTPQELNHRMAAAWISERQRVRDSADARAKAWRDKTGGGPSLC